MVIGGCDMPRGGKRIGAGSKFKWHYGKTKVIRVPEAIADRVLEYAHYLDDDASGVTQSLPIGYDSITQSKEINLSGILLRSLSGQPVVFLSDLVRIGYQILPEKLMQSPSLQSALKKQDRVSSLNNEIINDLSKNSLDYE